MIQFDEHPIPQNWPVSGPWGRYDPTLRQPAKNRLQGINQPSHRAAAQSPEDLEQALHELYVHQTELMMQNENLRQIQMALEASLALYADFYDMAPVGFITLNAKGLIQGVNLTTARLLGVVRSSLSQKAISRFIYPQDQNAFYLGCKQLVRSGLPQSLELRMIRHDGSPFWVLLVVCDAMDANGASVQRLVLSDISERKHLQEQLRESEQRWQFAVEGCGDGLWDWNLAQGTVFYSRSWKQMLGYGDFEVGQGIQAWEDRIHPDDKPVTTAAMRAYLDGKTFSYSTQHRLRCKDGSYKWMLDRGMVMSRDELGKPLRLIGTHSDITARKSAEAALQASELRYRTLIDEFQVGVLVYGSNAEILLSNAMALKLLGLTEDQLLGRVALDPGWSVMHENGTPFPIADQPVQQAIASRQPVRNVIMGIHNPPSAEPVWILVNAVPQCHADGTVQQVVCTLSDITERKRNEAELKAARMSAEAANLAKSRFLAAASHDLRQPLSALSLFVGVLRHKTSDQSTALVANIQHCVDNLSELLTDLLDVSKLDAGAVTPRLGEFDIKDFLTTLETIHAVEARNKGLQLRVRHAEELVARTDLQLLKRIVSNFVSNAIRYTRKGGVLIACRKRADKHWIEVWDTGIGIPVDKTDIIFEEFKQLDDDARTVGSGLGLAIAIKMANLLGLQIRVSSRPGRGSMFAIELPAGPPSRLDETPLLPALTSRTLRIGLVDDNPLVLQALSVMLESVGHTVVAALNGADLLKRLGQLSPDIVVSDYRLAGGQTGFEVIESIRSVFGAELPAIIITGDTNPTLIRSMRSRGITVHYKPLTAETLQAAICTAAERRAS